MVAVPANLAAKHDARKLSVETYLLLDVNFWRYSVLYVVGRKRLKRCLLACHLCRSSTAAISVSSHMGLRVHILPKNKREPHKQLEQHSYSQSTFEHSTYMNACRC